MTRKLAEGLVLCLLLIIVTGIAQPSLEKSPFVDAEIKSIDYAKVTGTDMVKNGSEVFIKVVLTNFSKEIEATDLVFQSELEGSAGHIKIDDGAPEALSSGDSYRIEHGEVNKAVEITWSVTAPEVSKRMHFVLLNITQHTTEGLYSVVEIEKDVTSEIIEDAVRAMNRAEDAIEEANSTIANATGIDVSDARTMLMLAKEHLDNSLEKWHGGMPGEALEEANMAFESARNATRLATSAKTTRQIGSYAIYAVVIVVAVIVLAVLLGRRSSRRRIY